LSEHLARDSFLTALADPDLELKIREREPADLDEAISIAERLEVFKDAVEKSAAGRQRVNRRVAGDNSDDASCLDMEATLKRLEERVDELQAARKAADQETVRLKAKNKALSREVGRLRHSQSQLWRGVPFQPRTPKMRSAKNGTRRLVCFSCGRPGHIARECRQRVSRDQGEVCNDGRPDRFDQRIERVNAVSKLQHSNVVRGTYQHDKWRRNCPSPQASESGYETGQTVKEDCERVDLEACVSKQLDGGDNDVSGSHQSEVSIALIGGAADRQHDDLLDEGQQVGSMGEIVQCTQDASVIDLARQPLGVAAQCREDTYNARVQQQESKLVIGFGVCVRGGILQDHPSFRETAQVHT